MTIGIYMITCTSTGDRYVGASSNIEHRFAAHRTRMKHGTHYNGLLQGLVNQYGMEAFTYTTLIECAAEELITYESRFIEIVKPELNLRQAGAGLRIPTQDTRTQAQKQVDRARQRRTDPEYRRKRNEYQRMLYAKTKESN